MHVVKQSVEYLCGPTQSLVRALFTLRFEGLGAATVDAIRLAAQLEGMITDPVYEEMSMLGIIKIAQSGETPRGSRVLYVDLAAVPRSTHITKHLSRTHRCILLTAGSDDARRPVSCFSCAGSTSSGS